MTEIATRDNGGEMERPAAQPEPAFRNSPLVQWAYEARKAAQVAQSLAKTSFVPATLRGKPADITAAILAGQELGLQPMATLRSIDVIQGTPALRAHAMRALVQSHGHEVELVESTPAKCVMRGRRKGAENWQQVIWTIERAGQLGLTGKNEWKKQPQTMLIARATGEICRLIASDALHAMPYNAEELTDTNDDEQAPPRVTAGEILKRSADEADDAGETAAEPGADDEGQGDDDPDAAAAAQAAAERNPWNDPDDPWSGIPVAQPGGAS
jgi:hypothetical protein